MTEVTGSVDRALITQELEAARDVAAHKAKAAEKRIRTWNWVHVLGGGLCAAGAAVAGGTALSDSGSSVVAGVFGLGASSLTALLAFLRPEQRVMANRRTHKAWSAVARQARGKIAILGGLDDAQAMGALEQVHASSDQAHDAYNNSAGESTTQE
ncbi:hypothetical protein ACIQU5_19885 [Streptomyces sp. NPDC090306]|uniref:hypothetical protein n=1 Tax=Streptomyces sp. NPDC090306 TaxID=3365961 RepID=UPI0037FAA192